MAYHAEAGQPIADASSTRWLVAGHQPELFHPGVWFKNFSLSQLAQRYDATSMNLIIDTDIAKPAILHAPSDGKIARIPFDRSSAETPYEERVVEEESTFTELPERMKPVAARWGFEPMLGSFWREVMAQAKRTPLLGERFAAARRSVERRWGCVQREVPMSRVCQTEGFAWFACAVLERLPEFHATYNQIVHDYRREHDIRSRSHPVPDLARDGDWLEAPFWAWRRGQSRRGKLLVRPSSAIWHLRVGGEDWPSIPCLRLEDAQRAWHALEGQGFKIRSRALTTTMFARLFLADLFVHGIGGGIYDALTDRIIDRFFGIPAPAFLIVSATLLLPLERFPDSPERVRTLARRVRDLTYKPELFLEPNDATRALIDAKKSWIARDASTHAERAERYHRIRELSAQFWPFVQEERTRVAANLATARQQAEWHRVGARRDYAFCLYPEEMLRSCFQNA
jgi:hypothetical protein